MDKATLGSQFGIILTVLIEIHRITSAVKKNPHMTFLSLSISDKSSSFQIFDQGTADKPVGFISGTSVKMSVQCTNNDEIQEGLRLIDEFMTRIPFVSSEFHLVIGMTSLS